MVHRYFRLLSLTSKLRNCAARVARQHLKRASCDNLNYWADYLSGKAVNVCSGSARLESGYRLFRQRFHRRFTRFPGKCAGSTLKKAASATFQILTYSSLLTVFSFGSVRYKFCGGKRVTSFWGFDCGDPSSGCYSPFLLTRTRLHSSTSPVGLNDHVRCKPGYIIQPITHPTR